MVNFKQGVLQKLIDVRCCKATARQGHTFIASKWGQKTKQTHFQKRKKTHISNEPFKTTVCRQHKYFCLKSFFSLVYSQPKGGSLELLLKKHWKSKNTRQNQNKKTKSLNVSLLNDSEKKKSNNWNYRIVTLQS